MKVERIINNNIVSSRDDDGNELVIMGRGLGFSIKQGQSIDEKKIEKIFRLESEELMERFKELLSKLPVEYVQLANEIITHAKETLQNKLNENVYLTLTDHISFAVERFKEGMVFPNVLFEEVKIFYPVEYSVGCHALYLIEKKTGIRLMEEEAASIAIHIVNAEFNSAISTTFTMTQMIREMMGIIVSELPDCGKESYYKDQLVIHLKQLVHRLLVGIPQNGCKDTVFNQFIIEHCPVEYRMICKVNEFINNKYGYTMTEQETIYLTINIKKIRDLYAQ